jgi:CheY-like chemotaxis protein
MDIQMPDMSGVDVTAHIRQHSDKARAQTPIIALTANAFRADYENYLAAGMNDCLAKPFEADELLRKIVGVQPVAPLPEPAYLTKFDLGYCGEGI